jgi:hypothetical protein
MQDVTTRPASPTSSEEELISDEMEKEVQKEVGYTSGIDSDTIDYSERRPGRSEDMGEIIALAFPYDTEMEYEDDADQERDIFDNGLEDDDSASESDASSTYEELMEPDIITKIIRAPASDSELEDGEDQELEDNCRDDAYSSDEAFASEYEAETETPKDSIEEAQNPPEQAHQEPTLSTEIQPLPKKSFSELQATKFKLLYQKAQYAPARVYRGVLIPEYTKDTGHRPTISLDEDCDNLRWKLLELEEAKKKIDLLITLRSAQLEAAESAKEAAEETFETQLQHSGISQELYNAYQAFCDSLDPEFGQRGGFSITCDADHQGSYPGYDAEFAIFKECVEIPYTQCNFRCEASKENSRKWILKDEKTQQRGWVPSIDSVVEFWPIKSPEPMNGTESTWGEQYVRHLSLYLSQTLANNIQSPNSTPLPPQQ